MCGIFGVVAGHESGMTPALFQTTVNRLFELSESRGKESAGLAMLNGGPIQVYKQPVAASDMIRERAYKRVLNNAIANPSGPAHRPLKLPIALIGHSRLVTNGAHEDNRNNQPVIAAGMAAVHNGIIVNDGDLWSRFPSLRRGCEVDTEVLLSLIRWYLEQGRSLQEAVREAYSLIEGCASVAVLFKDFDHLLLATNNGALYSCWNPNARLCVFASEEYILTTLLRNRALQQLFAESSISHCRPGYACFLGLEDAELCEFSLDVRNASQAELQVANHVREIVDCSSELSEKRPTRRVQAYSFSTASAADDADLLFEGKSAIERIRRCQKCILPATFPNITFDQNGVCNYCKSHQKIEVSGSDALEEAARRFRRDSDRPDCLVGISGGRDSCYGLHYVKNVLGMHPIAYTYDWGMVTDIARRNISRMCGKLGIEHVLVSADINRKREFIRKNVKAWLKRPDLGMVPLFMAGDKQFYYYANRLKKHTGIPLFVFCAGNEYEQTHFKTGFCGVGGASKGILRSLAPRDKIRLASYYARQAILNPAYINASIVDTLFAYFSSYMMPHDYIYLYHHIRWDERLIMKTLRAEYDWEVADDTAATWRIGDGTASFYNYIYYTVAGFTEFDTFRSNQIREGVIRREEALPLVQEENRPRYNSIKWYLSVIHMDIPFNDVIRRINAIPKRYAALDGREDAE